MYLYGNFKKLIVKLYKILIISGSCDWILMSLDSLELFYRDQHFGNKIIQNRLIYQKLLAIP